MVTSAKLRGSTHLKVYFLKLQMGVYLPAKFEVSSIILTSFRQNGMGGYFYFPLQNEPLNSPTRLRLIQDLLGQPKNIFSEPSQ